jgi:LacI family transcriptional regulator
VHAVARGEAFHKAVASIGLRAAEKLIPIEGDYPDIARQISAYREGLRAASPIPSGVTAVVCFNDALALALYSVLGERGLRVPEDISVIGFDNLFAASALPALTTVSHMLPEIGGQAVELALDILKTNRPYPYEVEIKVPAQLVLRESTGKAKRK